MTIDHWYLLKITLRISVKSSFFLYMGQHSKYVEKRNWYYTLVLQFPWIPWQWIIDKCSTSECIKKRFNKSFYYFFLFNYFSCLNFSIKKENTVSINQFSRVSFIFIWKVNKITANDFCLNWHATQMQVLLSELRLF